MIINYKQPSHYTISEVSELLKTEDLKRISDGIIGVVFYSEERSEVKNLIFNIIRDDPREQVKLVSIRALSHIARLDKNLDKAQVENLFQNLVNKENFNGIISDVLDDINIYC